MCKFLVVLTLVLGFVTNIQAADKPFGERSLMSDSSVAERVSRNGIVCLEGESCDGKAPSSESAEVAGDAAAGQRTFETVYNTYCAGCHATGAAGAPMVGDAGAWSDRVAQHGGEEALWMSGWEGIGMMPAKGMCGDCSEEEFATVVSYMLENSQ